MLYINSWLKIILDSLYDGILIINKEGIVLYINPAYTRITKVKEAEIIGKKLQEVRPGSKLTDLVKNGKTEIGTYRNEKDAEYIANMVPIIEKGNILGGISVINEVNDVYKLTEQLKNSKKLIRTLSRNLFETNSAKYFFEDIVAIDSKSIEAINIAKKMAITNSNILITGEIGTGKELYASAIHNFSLVKNSYFIHLNMSLLEELLKDEKTEFLKFLGKGTLFLDKISELEYNLQGKLLRIIEKYDDIRIICSTDKDLRTLVENEKFRRDLYYKIAIMPLEVPALRETPKNIPILINKFLKEFSLRHSKIISITQGAIKILSKYSWPGNIRELRNIMEFMCNMSSKSMMDIHDIPLILYNSAKKDVEEMSLNEKINIVEKEYINELIDKYGSSVDGKKKACKILGISLATLYNKLNQ